MIGYYVHHSGHGHLHRAISIADHLAEPVTALTSLDVPGPHPFDGILTLPRDDDAPTHVEPTAHGTLHWAPHHDTGLTQRMALIARWVAEARPTAIVVDVSVEIALFARLLGVPVIVVALPGERVDPPHQLVHQLADHILAAWPRELREPQWLHRHADKTSYVGGISRFDGRAPAGESVDSDVPRVLFVGGAGGGDVTQQMLDECAALTPEVAWSSLGLPGGTWKADPWPDICGAAVVVTHAGQGCVADVASAGRPAIIVPQPRPYGEQQATADTLRQHDLAVVGDEWPSPDAWPALIERARSLDTTAWERWRTRGAAERAAEVIAEVADRHAPRRTA